MAILKGLVMQVCLISGKKFQSLKKSHQGRKQHIVIIIA